MEVVWSGSASKHGIVRAQAWFVIENPEGTEEIEGLPGRSRASSWGIQAKPTRKTATASR
jgi:hypothetical protein